MLPCVLPYETCSQVQVPSGTCPSCAQAPLLARGTGITHHDHDTHYARAICVSCGAPVGILRAKVSTLFGIDEDLAVQARARVY